MGKRVVITGSTRGLGFGLARRFLERGCRVVVNGSSLDSTLKAMEKLGQYTANAAGVAADIRNPHDIRKLYDAAVGRFGGVDIWINNAGISHEMRSAWELDSGVIDSVLDVNIRGVLYGTIIPFEGMIKTGGGKIFTMEGLGSDGFMLDGMSVYGTTKSAVSYFTRSFAHEVRGMDVQIGTLSPGMVVTDMLRSTVSDGSPESLKKRKFFNVMADDVEIVSEFLCGKILASTSQSPRIKWLTRHRMIGKILLAPFRKRDFFS